MSEERASYTVPSNEDPPKDAAGNIRKPRFSLSDELGDGQHREIVDDVDVVLTTLRPWLEEMAGHGTGCCDIEIVMLSDEEVAALPDL